MGWPQILAGTALIVGLLVVAGYFLWSQVCALRQLDDDVELSGEEIAFQRRQAYRRFVAGVVMVVLAVLLLDVMIFFEAPAQALADERGAILDPDASPMTEEQKAFARHYGVFWLVILFFLAVLLALAAWDYLALRRFGWQQRQRIREDRREMIAREADRLRQERDDLHG